MSKKAWFAASMILIILGGLVLYGVFTSQQRKIRVGDKINWQVAFWLIGSTWDLLQLDVSVESETNAVWSAKMTYSYNSSSQNVVETISKNGSTGGFSECSGDHSGYWLGWIDTRYVTETNSLTVPGDLVGHHPTPLISPDFWLDGPFTFKVEAGKLWFKNETRDS